MFNLFGSLPCEVGQLQQKGGKTFNSNTYKKTIKKKQKTNWPLQESTNGFIGFKGTVVTNTHQGVFCHRAGMQ